MTIGKMIGSTEFKNKHVLETLICHHLSLSREKMRCSVEQELGDADLQKIKSDYHGYTVDKKPLEYVLGYVEFFDRMFIVNENTLIPRPETEYMITGVTEFVQQTIDKNQHTVLLDIGTGCGVLCISVLLQNPGYFDQVIFSDLSQEALAVAKKNYEILISENTRKEWGKMRKEKNSSLVTYNSPLFVQSDLVAFLDEYSSLVTHHSSLILVANLPYIPDQTFDDNAPENVKSREPRMAFVGGDDGLDLYRRMFRQIENLKIEDGKLYQDNKNNPTHFHLSIFPSFHLFLEMMTRQVDILRKEFAGIMEFTEIKTFHFNIRIVKATFLKKM